ncbi:MAG: energy transducer TonB [Acidobacteriota bacterium]|nr:energy transducer TonB [Acidobacteriota bacterium]
MFEKLIESTNEKEIKKQSAYFGLTTVFYSILLLGILVWSVFSFDLSDLNGNSDLTLESLVAPATEIEPEPPQLRVNTQQKNNEQKNVARNYDVLVNPVENIKNSTKPPEGITTDKVSIKEIRDGVKAVVGTENHRAIFSGGSGRIGNSAPPVLETTKPKSAIDEIDIPPPPVVKKPEPPREEKKLVTVSKGVVNGFAIRLPKPAYPATAKAVNASGVVNVQVLIDEEGNVVSAVATNGHPLLKAAAVNAAKQAKFTPTKLSEQPVKVTGVIVYNFIP